MLLRMPALIDCGVLRTADLTIDLDIYEVHLLVSESLELALEDG